MTKRIIRCCPPALLFLALMLAAGIAQAGVGDHTTGLPTTKTCPGVAPDPPGTPYNCTFEITNADDQHGVRDLTVTDTAPFPGGTETQVACNQLAVDISTMGTNAGLGASGSGTESCSGSITIDPPFNCTTSNQFNQDRIQANGFDDDTGQFANLPVDGGASNNTLVPPLDCDDNNICTTDTCSVETGCSNAAIVCADDGDPCTLDPLCDPLVPGSELCPNPAGNDSTPCGTDTDGNDCTAPGCAAGVCVQNHILDQPSTPCGTDGDPNDCVEPGCTASGECSPTHLNVPASDPCGTDTDGLTCTIPGCPGGGAACSQTHIDNCEVNEEICRTPGFFGTHGGTEKEGAQNITLAILNAYNALNDPDLQICGETINNTNLGSNMSALEAICVSPKGDQRLQLARQLTAAALNCILSTATGADAASCNASLAGGDVCGGVSIGGIFDACNAECAADGDLTVDVDLDEDPLTPDVEVSCIGAIDCFNNGGVLDPATGECLDCFDAERDPKTGECPEDCHDRDLVTECFDFPNPGPAGSPKECNDSRKNSVTIFTP